MKEYISPEVEFVEFEEDIITASSCNGYSCPNAFGNTCAGNPYGGA